MLSIGPYSYDTVAEAIEGLQAVTRERGGEDPNAQRALAEALALCGRAEEAIEAYRAAIAQGATAADQLRLAELLMRRQRPLEARAHLVKAAASDDPDRDWRIRVAKGFDELADCYFAAGDLPTALECHDMAWQLLPGHVESAIAAALKQHEDNVLRSLMPGLRRASEGGATLYAALVVWGEAHTRQFLTTGLPSLLAPGNLPALVELQRVALMVFASKASIASLDAAPGFATLRRHADVIFIEIPDVLIAQTAQKEFPANVRYRITLQLVTAQHHVATIMAAARGAGVLFLVPDWVLSDGCLRAIGEGLDAGKEVFAAPILLANRDGLVRVLAPYAAVGATLKIPAADLARLGAANLHDSWRQFVPRGDRFAAQQFPSWMVWPFADAGLVTHMFHWSVLCVSAARLAKYEGQRFWTLDHRLLDALLESDADWANVTLCSDTRELTIIALDSEGKDYAWAAAEAADWGLPELVAGALPGTSLLSLSRVNHLLVREAVVFGGTDGTERDAAIARARALVDAIEAQIAEVSIKRA